MPNRLQSRDLAHVVFRADWQSHDASHSDVLHVEKFNAWRDLDLLPLPLQQALLDQPIGHSATQAFAAGYLVDSWQPTQRVTVRDLALPLRLKHGQPVIPRLGRFYPRGLLNGHVSGIYSEEMQPMRYVAQQGTVHRFDLNHPLANHAITLSTELRAVYPNPGEHGGRCNEVLRELLRTPGMKAPRQSADDIQLTDFFSGQPFARLDDGPDEQFYRTPRLLHHLDAHARQTVSALYDRLLSNGSRVLDLMSSWTSHLSDTLDEVELHGLGLNEEELGCNPRLSSYRVQNLNATPQLPYPDAHFDAVICTASVEYLTDPHAVFSEVARVLKPNGVFVNVFSNRWFRPKAIALWGELHEYERPAVVCDYYRWTGQYTGLHTYSESGLARPHDDPHSHVTHLSDPVHAVWARKAAE